MKAIVIREFGAPEVMKLEELPDPAPGHAQVLVRVKAIGVNPVDTYIRAGAYARKPALPFTPGTDVAGVIEKTGPAVTLVKVGDRVYSQDVALGSGAYAELTVCDETHVHRLPDHVTFQQGAAVGGPYATAWRALFLRGQAKAGETVFVHGASGGVGSAAVQLARAAGMRVVGTAGTAKGVALVREVGAHDAINHRDAGYIETAMELSGGRGFDVILEMLANVNLDRDLELLALRGRVVIVGNRGRVEIDPRKAMGKDGAILGLLRFNATPDELKQAHAALVAGLESGSLKPVVGKEMKLADAIAAHEAVLEPGAYGKIVMIP